MRPVIEALEARALPSFLEPVKYLAGEGPREPVVIDFNGDGRRDVAVALRDQDAVSVLLGNGTGALSPPQLFATDRGPFGLEVGDLNLDGKLDLVSANNGSSTVSVLLGNGDGTFQPRFDFYAGPVPLGVAIGDLNGDGNPDVAVADNGVSTVAVLFGNGDGTLKFPEFREVGEKPIGVEIADLDADGVSDLTAGSYHGDAITVFLASGVTKSYFMGNATWGHSVADVNKDSKPDLIVTQRGINSISVLLNRGDGTFKPRTDFPCGGNPLYTAVADFNRDRKPDIAVFQGYSICLMLGNGNGTFQPCLHYVSGLGSFGAHFGVGDLNNDRFPEIVGSGGSHEGEGHVSALLNDTNWSAPIPLGSGPEDEPLIAPPTFLRENIYQQSLTAWAPRAAAHQSAHVGMIRGPVPTQPSDAALLDDGDAVVPGWAQRGPGFPRIVNGTIDIGAFEVQATGSPLPTGARRGSPDLAIFITADLNTDDTNWRI